MRRWEENQCEETIMPPLFMFKRRVLIEQINSTRRMKYPGKFNQILLFKEHSVTRMVKFGKIITTRNDTLKSGNFLQIQVSQKYKSKVLPVGGTEWGENILPHWSGVFTYL